MGGHDRWNTQNVYRSEKTLSNQLGHWLTDVGDKLSKQSARRYQAEPNMEQDLLGKGIEKAATVAKRVGRSLVSYEPVALAEAIAAQSTLILEQKTERAKLNSQYYQTQAQLENLNHYGNTKGNKTLIVMDQASLTGILDAERIVSLAAQMKARVVFQGDTKQLGSVSAGRAFAQAQQAGMKVSVLEETRRFDRATKNTRRAIELMGVRDYSGAIAQLDRQEVSQAELADTVAKRYLENLEEARAKGIEQAKISVVTLTNADRKQMNEQVHEALQRAGEIDKGNFTKEHFDSLKLTNAEKRHVNILESANAQVIVFNKSYREIGVANGDQILISRFDAEKNLIHGKNGRGRQIVFNPKVHDFFGAGKLEEREYSNGDLIEARVNIDHGKKSERITNGTRGVITQINEKEASIAWSENGSIRTSVLTNTQLRNIDYAYARTSFKEQGSTTDREIIAISETGAKIVNQQSAYVMATRAKGNTELITSNFGELQKNAGRSIEKSTAMDISTLNGFMDKEINIFDTKEKGAPERTHQQEEAILFSRG